MKEFDVVIVGAGIQGAGVAQAAAAAGYRVLVLEKNEIASGTSSKSSKLIHGGLRYLESYQFSLVRKSLKVRAILCRLATELVKLQPFYIPLYETTIRKPWQIRLGLSLYAILGGLRKENLFKSMSLNKTKIIDKLEQNKLKKIYRYYDGQTNDVKLTKAVILSSQQLGAELRCSANVTDISESKEYSIVSYQNSTLTTKVKTRIVVNASGPWVNELNQFLITANSLDIDLVQGTHIIIDAVAPSGIYYLEAEDQRAVFIMPYEFEGKIKTMVGTTEKLFQGKADDVKPSEEEISYLLNTFKAYFPMLGDVKVMHSFAGLRVLPKSDGGMFSRPRDTVLSWSTPKLLTLYGGKLTAYRSTADLVIKKIQPILGRRLRIAYTDQLALY